MRGCRGRRTFKAVFQAVLEKGNLLLVLQIGNLDDYYHFYHSKTFKRSTLSSRGPHTFLRMDPQVHARQVRFLRTPVPGTALRKVDRNVILY